MPDSSKHGPSVKDDDVYEAIRAEGGIDGRSSMSKQQLIEALRTH